MATQQLATKDDFFIYGLSSDRLPAELIDSEDTTIDSWLSAASAKILRVFNSFLQLPLVEWGEDIKQLTCVLAAWEGKGVIGLPAGEAEYEQLLERYDRAIQELDEIKTRHEAPSGVVDSFEASSEDDISPAVNLIVGYEKQEIGLW